MSATYTDVSCQVSLIQKKKIKDSCFQRWKEWSQPLSSSAYHPKSIFQYFCLLFGISALLFIFAGFMWTLRKAKARAAYSNRPAATVSQKDVLIKAQQDGHSRRTHKPVAPLGSLHAWPAMAEASGKRAGIEREENRVLYNMHQLSSLKSCSQASRMTLKWQGKGCSDVYPGGALKVTDNLLCRGLIEPNGLINESHVFQAMGEGSGCWAYSLHFSSSGRQIAILRGYLLPTSFLGFAIPVINCRS